MEQNETEKIPGDSGHDSFRDSIATVNTKGKRVWIYPKKPKGRFYNARNVVSFFLLLILFGLPFINVNGKPLLLLNIIEREFILFGLYFGPFDFNILVLVMIAVIVFVVLFTAIYGRLFCGWVCPQTVFMEMVFRKIEYWIEGDASAQRKLNAPPMNGAKFRKKALKIFIFSIFSVLIAHTFLAYNIGVERVFDVITSPPSDHFTGFLALYIFSAIFLFVFLWFREQACIIVCPYGRLQGVLLDKNSIAVTYDFVRGEPRAPLKKNAERTEGDCIDCEQCVHVCPTGIDIRNGIQLECVNCTACIDACDDVMVKINKPRGLVRYSSQNNIKEKTGFKITPRIILYSILLVLLLSIITVLVANRKDVEVNIMRTPGMLFQEQPDGRISNIYNFHIINKTYDEIPIELRVEQFKGDIQILGDDLNIEPHNVHEGKFILILSKEDLTKQNVPVLIGVYQNGAKIDEIKSSFLTHIKPVKK